MIFMNLQRTIPLYGTTAVPADENAAEVVGVLYPSALIPSAAGGLKKQHTQF